MAYGGPVIGIAAMFFNPFLFMSVAAIANGIYVLRSVRHPDTAKHLEASMEQVKVGAIAGMVLGRHHRGARHHGHGRQVGLLEAREPLFRVLNVRVAPPCPSLTTPSPSSSPAAAARACGPPAAARGPSSC